RESWSPPVALLGFLGDASGELCDHRQLPYHARIHALGGGWYRGQYLPRIQGGSRIGWLGRRWPDRLYAATRRAGPRQPGCWPSDSAERDPHVQPAVVAVHPGPERGEERDRGRGYLHELLRAPRHPNGRQP